MAGIDAIEEACEARHVTLVVHPAVRRAIAPYGESFFVGATAFLRGESDGAYYLPLGEGSHVELRFSRRLSADGYPILRIEPLAPEGLARIKRSVIGTRTL